MRAWRSVLVGLSLAAMSCLILSGSLLIFLAENGYRNPNQFLELTKMVTISPPATQFIIPGRFSSTITKTFLATNSSTPTSVSSSTCNPPSGWAAIIIQPEDSLSGLSSRYGIGEDSLASGNCVEVSATTLQVGMVFYIPQPRVSLTPPSPSPSQSSSPSPSFFGTATYCFHPPGWMAYTVKPGDTLSKLSQELNISISQLQVANCLDSHTYIRSGQRLFDPQIPGSAIMQSPFPPLNPPILITPIYTYIAPHTATMP